MEKVGDKATARDLMQKAGLPLLPGTVEPVSTVDEAREIADEIGYPVIIKAVAGGGGRGMSVVWTREDLPRLYQHDPRHGAGRLQGQRRLHRALPRGAAPHGGPARLRPHGNGVYFGERDCSVQRRHQKLIEEAPSIHLTPEMRDATSARRPCRARSRSATPAPGRWSSCSTTRATSRFMEMNARIQVEHPVSEMITTAT